MEEISEDFWRRTFYQAPVGLVSFAVYKLRGSLYFQQLMAKARAYGIRIVPEIPEPSLKTLSRYRAVLHQL
ncbi:MAG: hypothetical protein JSW39_09215 [Desulfobacterales bacterium]|nr:MAG: hypothetical protein JSW39_09215 [Desulfobacterales bacterium]